MYMTTAKEYIDSGILELYVLGSTNTAQSREVEFRAGADQAVRREIAAIQHALEGYAREHSITPDATVKPFLLATIDYTERLKNGEPVAEPPALNETSVIEDYAEWLNRSDMMTKSPDNIYAKIIGYTPAAITAIIWIKDFAPQEVHQNELEKFLVVEGCCNIVVEDKTYQLIAGDYFAIPLYKNHMVKVTSTIPCKIILQRTAA